MPYLAVYNAHDVICTQFYMRDPLLNCVVLFLWIDNKLPKCELSKVKQLYCFVTNTQLLLNFYLQIHFFDNSVCIWISYRRLITSDKCFTVFSFDILISTFLASFVIISLSRSILSITFVLVCSNYVYLANWTCKSMSKYAL